MGYGCKSKAEAEAKVAELIAKLDGEGWKARVWQNFGWHYEARLGFLQVYPTIDGEFHVLLGLRDAGGGQMFWTTEGASFKDPNDAVRNQLEIAREFLAKATAVVELVEEGFVEPV
jgi:hypothetical protein